ncbi:MAG: hypothetical protein WA040_04045 [Anaerolineae bacterium]
MNYPINIDGFEGQTLEMKPSGMFAGPHLLVNGQPAAKGPKRGQMLLRRTDGSEAIATWKPQFMGLDVPRLDVDGKQINVVEPLKWYVWVWSGLPILLVFIGGALGVLAGIVAFGINTQIFRSSRSTGLKFVLTAIVSVLAVAVYLALAVLLSGVLGRA